MKSGSLNLLEPSRPVQACTGVTWPSLGGSKWSSAGPKIWHSGKEIVRMLQSRSGYFRGNKNLFPLSGIEPRFLGCSALSVFTACYPAVSEKLRWVLPLHHLKNGWQNAVLIWCMLQAGPPLYTTTVPSYCILASYCHLTATLQTMSITIVNLQENGTVFRISIAILRFSFDSPLCIFCFTDFSFMLRHWLILPNYKFPMA